MYSYSKIFEIHYFFDAYYFLVLFKHLQNIHIIDKGFFKSYNKQPPHPTGKNHAIRIMHKSLLEQTSKCFCFDFIENILIVLTRTISLKA